MDDAIRGGDVRYDKIKKGCPENRKEFFLFRLQRLQAGCLLILPTFRTPLPFENFNFNV
jgi:hypothetical protein